jgi:hypothetical protein
MFLAVFLYNLHYTFFTMFPDKVHSRAQIYNMRGSTYSFFPSRASSQISLHIPQDVSIHFPQQIPDHVALHVSEDIYCSSRQLSEPGLPGVWTFYLDLHQLLAGLPGSWRMRPPPPHLGGFTCVKLYFEHLNY